MLFLFHVIYSHIALADAPNIEQNSDPRFVVEDGIVDENQAKANTVDIGLLIVHASSSGNSIDPKFEKFGFSL